MTDPYAAMNAEATRVGGVQQAIIAAARRICGQGNCNCPGAAELKALLAKLHAPPAPNADGA